MAFFFGGSSYFTLTLVLKLKRMNMTKRLTILSIALLLAACAAAPPVPGPGPTERGEDAPVEERVRAPAGRDAGAGMQAYPLQNPAVTELAEAARQAERDGDLERASILLERALRIQPRDPEVLQQLAEVQLAKENWPQAESHAARSFDVGPRMGELCARNWRTMEVARERQGDNSGAAQARERAAQCLVDRPPRL